MEENNLEKKLNLEVKETSFDEMDFEDFDFDSMEEMLNQDVEEMMLDLDALSEEKEKLTNPDSLGKEIYNSIFNQLNAQSGMDLQANSGEYGRNIRGELDKANNQMYSEIHTKSGQINQSPNLDGFIAEVDQAATYNINAATQKKDSRAKVLVREDGKILGKNSADIVVKDGRGRKVQVYQAKMGKDAQATSAYLDKGNYNNQRYLISDNQVDSVKGKLDKRSNKTVTSNIEYDGVSSTSRNKEDYKKIQEDIQQKGNIKKYGFGDVKKKDLVKNGAADAGKAALRGTIMSAAATLIKSIIDSLVEFFKSKKKTWSEFFSKMKQSISNFFVSLKQVFKNSMSGGIGSVVNNIAGAINKTITKVWGALKTGFSTIKNAIKIFTSPENKNKPFSVRLAEFGKVIAAGLAIAGTMLLSEVLTNLLTKAFPPLEGVVLPVIGSVLGLIVEIILAILGGIVTGIAINFLNKFIAGKQRSELDKKIISKQNDVLDKQHVQIAVVKKGNENHKKRVLNDIDLRHKQANEVTQKTLDEIFTPVAEADHSFDDMQADLDMLL